jgi:hypothetical protein
VPPTLPAEPPLPDALAPAASLGAAALDRDEEQASSPAANSALAVKKAPFPHDRRTTSPPIAEFIAANEGKNNTSCSQEPASTTGLPEGNGGS